MFVALLIFASHFNQINLLHHTPSGFPFSFFLCLAAPSSISFVKYTQKLSMKWTNTLNSAWFCSTLAFLLLCWFLILCPCHNPIKPHLLLLICHLRLRLSLLSFRLNRCLQTIHHSRPHYCRINHPIQSIKRSASSSFKLNTCHIPPPFCPVCTLCLLPPTVLSTVLDGYLQLLKLINLHYTRFFPVISSTCISLIDSDISCLPPNLHLFRLSSVCSRLSPQLST